MAEAWDEGRRVDAVELMGLVGEIFRACGMDDDDAHLMADSLVYADLGGVHSHGVLRVPEYAEKLTAAGVDPRGGGARLQPLRSDGLFRNAGHCARYDRLGYHQRAADHGALGRGGADIGD